jgi:hypothetical protein
MAKKGIKQYKTTTFWMEDDPDILFFQYTPKIEIDITIAKEIINSRFDYTRGRPMYTLIDFSNVKSVTKEARDYMNDPEGGLKGILGGAFLSNNAVSTLFVNLYLRINKPTVPAKFFTRKEDALNWLKRIKMENEIISKIDQ